MKALIVLVLSCLIVGCATRKETSVTTSDVAIRRMEESIKTIIKSDVPVLVKPSLQLSVSVGVDSSKLETDYAISTAYWDGQRLWHRIWNKDSFMVTVPQGKVEEKESYNTNTSSVEKKKDYQLVEKERYRFFNAFFYWCGIVAFTLTILFVVFRFIKFIKLRR